MTQGIKDNVMVITGVKGEKLLPVRSMGVKICR